MLEAADEPLDFSRADLGSREIEWRRRPKRALRRLEPILRRNGIAFEEGQRLGEEPCGAEEAIGLARKEPTVALASRERSARHVDERHDAIGRQLAVADEALEGAEWKPLRERAKERRGIERVEAEEDDVGVRPRCALSQEVSESFEISSLSAWVRTRIDEGAECHLA